MQAAGSGGSAAPPPADAERRAIKQAAQLVADRFVQDGQTLGLGTGVAVNELIEVLAARVDRGQLRRIRVVPGSDATASECAFHGLPLEALDAAGPVSVMVEVADELALGPDGSLAFIIGRQHAPHQQPQLPRARRLAAAAAACVVVAEAPSILVPALGGALPVVIDAEDWEDTGAMGVGPPLLQW